MPAILVALLTLVLSVLLPAPVARAQTAMLTSSDFALGLARIDPSSGAYVALDDSGLASYLSAARCACPTNVVVGLGLSSDAAAQLSSGDTLDATIMIGNDCDNVAATACQTLGSVLTLDASKTATTQTLATSLLFSAIPSGTDCAALKATTSRLWTIIRQNGTRLASQPSLAIGFGGAAPVAPTAVKLQTADSGLLVSWTAVADSTRIQGYQVLCSPGPATPLDAAYETCAALPPPAGTGPFTPLDPKFICSALVGASTTSARVHGLTNGSTYQIAVIAIGNDGTPSAPSEAVQGAPGPTLGFDDIYTESGGTAQAGCALAGRPGGRDPGGCVLGGALLGALLLRRGRGRGRNRGRGARALVLAVVLAAPLAWARAAHADDGGNGGFHPSLLANEPAAATPVRSPQNWNLELRFGPYLPAIDSEFADRGQSARPFQQVFSSSKRLLSQVELDRQLVHWGGTWGLGFAAGAYRATARSLAADHVTRTGDETSLRLIPVSVAVVYRADLLHQRTGFPLVPYAKTGIDCTFWSISDTAKSSASSMKGSTLGWHAAAGVTLDLSMLDPEAAHTLDMESGVNQFAVFFELAHYAIDGLGSSSALRVGDTTWLTGIMLEL